MRFRERFRKRLSDLRRRFGIAESSHSSNSKRIDVFWARNFIKQLSEMEGVPPPEVNTIEKLHYSFTEPDTIRVSKTYIAATAALRGIWIESAKDSLAHEFKHYLQRYQFEPEKVSLKGWTPTGLVPPTKEGKKWVKYYDENKERLQKEANRYGWEHSGISSKSEEGKMAKAKEMILMEYVNEKFGPYENMTELFNAAMREGPWIGWDMKRFLKNHPKISEKYKNPLKYLPSMKERFGQ